MYNCPVFPHYPVKIFNILILSTPVRRRSWNFTILMHPPNMMHQPTHLSKFFITHIAAVRCLIAYILMQFFMPVAVHLLIEPFLADSTLERLLVSVNPHVLHQILLLVEAFIANRAGVRLHAAVELPMFHQRVLILNRLSHTSQANLRSLL